ncbi:hypothetical protein I6H07_06235 [Hafnia alvei]|nr:DNA polymerase [Hafnia alvei]MBI0275433.1 hypothetical protein [Hafnia alvei]PNK98574.1 hypothetical protein CEQ28_013760 [Hafnia alvei]
MSRKYPAWDNLFAGDIETTGLLDMMKRQLAPRLHNFGLIDVETEKETCLHGSNRNDVQAFLDTKPTVIMHNGVLFDKEALSFLGYNVSDLTIIDTLFISWYLEPKRVKHGLEEYGVEFGIPKPPIADWENLTQEEYDFRVMQDSRIQLKLWKRQYSQLLRIYGTHQEVMRFIDYLMSKANQLRIQQNTRWKLDVSACEALKKKIDAEIEEKVVALSEVMPKVPIKKIKGRPAKCFKISGGLTKDGMKWKAICDGNNLDFNDKNLEVMMITGYNKGNPASPMQIKDWLFSLGWEPETFKFDRNKETNEVRQIPQITKKDDDGNPDICPSLYKLAKKHPDKGIEHLIGLGVLKHRSSVCNGFLNNNVDGYLTARCGGLTNTLRLKHRELVNLPSPRVMYGKELRGLLIADEDFEELGSDLCSLEDRCKHHYQWPYDPEYVKKQMREDYDPHLEVCLIGGLLTEQQVSDHKAGIHKYSDIRHRGKGTNYSCQYGAFPPTVARAAGVDLEMGKLLHTAYWKLNWSIKEIAASTIVKTVDGQMWQQNPVNKFWYWLKNEKDRFSTLCQGTGSYIFDVWCNAVITICQERYKQDPKLAGQFHDEMILLIRKGCRDIWNGIMKDAMVITNRLLKMNRQIDCDVQYGNCYSDIH